MLSEESPLYKDGFSEDERRESYRRPSSSLFLTILAVAGISVLGIVLVFTCVVSRDTIYRDIATVDTLAPLQAPTTPATRVTRPSDEYFWLARNTSATLSTEHAVPYPLALKDDCTGSLCRLLAQWIRSNLDHNIDPCNDFYRHVCAKFRGHDVFLQIEKAQEIAIKNILMTPNLPVYFQRPWQKAAAMYQACVSFASSFYPQTGDLVKWMILLNLDLTNEVDIGNIDPADMIVRGSLDFGIDIIISITLQQKEFASGKRAIQTDYSEEQYNWFFIKNNDPETSSVRLYASYLRYLDPEHEKHYEIALKIHRYEKRLHAIADAALLQKKWELIAISKLGRYTTPHVKAGEWVKHFSKWTNGTYTGSNIINHGIHSTTILKNLFEDESVGNAGLQYLVAWSIYRQLIRLTDPYAFRSGRKAEDACYEHVMKVMALAIYSHYFNSTVPPRMVYQTKRMVSRIRRAFERSLNSSSWMDADIKANAINKLINITAYVGSPGKRLDPRFVAKIYESYPDVPLKRPFDAWIKALSLSTHYLWKDRTTFLYDEGDVNTYNLPFKKVILIPTAVMTRPLLYLYGPIGLNYGGLGMFIGHEFMHSFGVGPLQQDKWLTDEFRKEYTKRALCLRRSHKSVLSVTGEEETWDDHKDSENLCDLVGTKVAYDAFASLPEKYKRIKLVGMDTTSEQLFFINHCVKWCAQLSEALPPHAPFRSRCIVPLMNMPEFAKAFNCASGTPMNPKNKCSLW